MNGQYMIYRRNRTTGIRESLLERYTEFSLILNWGEVSKFSISGSTVGDVELQPGDGLVWYRNGVLFFSGIVDQVEVSCENVADGLKSWTADGYEDSVIFSRWLAFADPTDITFAEGVVDKCGDYAWNRMLHYIRRNMGADALSGRQIDGLTLPAAGNVGQNTESAYRYEALDKVLQEIGSEVDADGTENALWAAFVRDPDTGALSVEITAQRDLTASVIIAPEFGNIINWTKTETLPKCNAVWVCSGTYQENDRDKRLWIYREDADSIGKYGRFESVITKSDIKVMEDDPETEEDETVTEAEAYVLLENEARAALDEGAYHVKFSGTMVETPELQFMVHWGCGDKVSCVIDGEKFETTIKTVEIEYADRFEQVTPTLGETEHGIYADIFKQLRGLDTRMKQEELS